MRILPRREDDGYFLGLSSSLLAPLIFFLTALMSSATSDITAQCVSVGVNSLRVPNALQSPDGAGWVSVQ